jgi:hypothetical protein
MWGTSVATVYLADLRLLTGNKGHGQESKLAMVERICEIGHLASVGTENC